MKTSQSQKILREYVKQILVEDDYGGMMDAAAGMSPYGVHYASSDALYKTFIKPFVDVVQVTAGKTKEISRSIQTVATVAFETIATTLLPFLTDDYKDIFEKEKADLDKIQSEYGEVYAATWDALKDNDAALTAFFCCPGAVLTSVVARTAPKATMKMLSVISGGSLDGFLAKVKNSFDSSFGTNSKSSSKKSGFSTNANHGSSVDHGGYYNMGGTGGMGENRLYEDDARRRRRRDNDISWHHHDDKKKKPKQKLEDVLTNKKVIAKALASPEAQRMQKAAREMVQKTLQTVYARAEAVSSAKSIEDLQKKIGKPLKGMDKLKKVDQKERQAAEAQVLGNLKKSMKEFYAKSLESQVKDAIKAGIPKDSDYVKDYAKVIQKIREL